MREREKVRLDYDSVERPDTKWVFEGFLKVDVKLVLDNKPLLGAGQLPDWLRNLSHGRNMFALDTYNDNLCLWRCMAVHNGARPDRCTSAARLLAMSFFKLKVPPKDFPKTSLDQLEEVEFYFNLSKKIEDWFSFRVYEPELLKDGQVVWHLRKIPSEKIKKIITIGIYEDHAFLIKDVSKIANVYNCIHCNARFTKSSDLHRHSNTCSKGVTKIKFLNKKVDSMQTGFEKAFFPKKKSDSNEAIRWLEKESKLRGIHIHHAICGHGGERLIENRPVDGYNHETNTVFQYHGCYWHGCRKCFPNYRDEVVDHVQTLEERYQSTVNVTKKLRDSGYNVVEIWSCEVKKKKNEFV